MTSTDPAGGVGAWNTTNVYGQLEAVSCASVRLCVAVDNGGDVWTSTDPTGGASVWSEVHVDENELRGVSCPSAKMCIAVDYQHGDVVSTTDPTGGAGAWTVTNVDPNTLYGVSCSSESLCVAIDNDGNVLTSIDPTGGASAWASAHVSGGLLEHVSCASWGFCVALNGNEVVTSTEPTGGSGAWTATPIETVSSSLDGASCPTKNLCVLVDGDSEVVTSSEPTRGAGAWTVTPVEVGDNDLQGVSCALVELCVWVDDAGNVVTSTNPTGGPSAWIESHIDEHVLNGVSCPSAGFCVAVDDAGDILTSTDPAGGSDTWSLADVDGTTPLNHVSCASVNLCVAIDREGDVVASDDPAGGASAWSVASLGDSWLGGVACPSEHLCVVTETNTGDLVTSTEPAGGGSTWSARNVGAGSLGSISCSSVSLCVATGDRPEAVIGWGDPTSGPWAEASFEDLNGFGMISCAAGGLCLATSFGGDGAEGNVIVSSEPAGGLGTWSTGNVYGPFGPAIRTVLAPFFVDDITGVSCVMEGMCVVGDTRGRVMVGTPQPATTLEDTVLPAIAGTPVVGETLTCGNGTWTGEPVPTFTYQWLRDGGAPIPGATAETYVVQAVAAGESLSCEVTATNSAGHKAATSQSVHVAATAPEETVVPVVSGMPAVGGTLVCANGQWSGGPSPMFTDQWLRNGAPISGATGSSYQVQVVDAGESLSCEVTATNSAGRKSATSRSVPVVAMAPENTAMPVVSGTPVVGDALSCSNGSWTGNPAPTFTYGWLRDDVPIPGATATSTYVVQAADAGQGLSCEVTATNSAGRKSATSSTLQVPVAQELGSSGDGGSSSGGGSSGGGSSSGASTGTVSNAFTLIGMTNVAKLGTVKITLDLPGPGRLQIVGKESAVRPAKTSHTVRRNAKHTGAAMHLVAQLNLTVTKAGRMIMTLTPVGSAKRMLAKRGRLGATVTITYTPKGGTPRSIVRTVIFRLKRRR